MYFYPSSYEGSTFFEKPVIMPLYRNIIFVLGLIISFCVVMTSQEVAISEELSIRNYFSYELLGQIDDRILIYRDKGFSKEIDVYNEDMEHTQFSEFIFEKKKTDVYTILGQDTAFQMIYGYLERDSLVLKLREYDKVVRLIDSTTLTKIHKKEIKRRFSHSISEDKSKILLTTINNENQVRFILYDCRFKAITWHHVILFPGRDFRDFDNIVVTNDGRLLMQVKNSDFDIDRLDFILLAPRMDMQFDFSVDLSGHIVRNSFFKYDNQNLNIIVCGNYADKKGKEVKGMYFFKKNINDLYDIEPPQYMEYNSSLGQELLQGKKRNKKHAFDDLEVKDVILRNDGGALVISEITKDFSRRSPYNSTYSRNDNSSFSRRGWVDYYNEDIVVHNVNPEMTIDWTKVLYKKQFSQDDDAVFSSFYVMKTPSRLRFIYNDDIKQNSTVSEYLMDPTGRIARNSLLSTQYQNMKLRFGDALQLSANSILIPSEKNYDLNLVKITY